MIPPILHQTWKSAALPELARRLQQGWLTKNPDLEYRFYDDAACRDIFADAFEDYLPLYDALPYGVMRADVFRYAVLFRDGGVYADIDMECLQPIERLLKLDDGLLSVEAHLGRTRQRELKYVRPVQIANCILASRPGHPFFAAAVTQCFAASAEQISIEAIEDQTGPRMLTRLYFSARHTGLTVLPQIMLMAPLEYPLVWPFKTAIYARHRNFGSWKQKRRRPSPWRWFVERNRLPNPFGRVPPSGEQPS